MARQALAQSRHDLAQSTMCLSSLNFSHSFAHSSQVFAHPSQAVAENGLCRADSLAASAQNSAQSTQACMVLACSFFPFSTRAAQVAEARIAGHLAVGARLGALGEVLVVLFALLGPRRDLVQGNEPSDGRDDDRCHFLPFHLINSFTRHRKSVAEIPALRDVLHYDSS